MSCGDEVGYLCLRQSFYPAAQALPRIEPAETEPNGLSVNSTEELGTVVEDTYTARNELEYTVKVKQNQIGRIHQ